MASSQPPVLSSRKRESTEQYARKKTRHSEDKSPIRLLLGIENLWTMIGKYLTFADTYNMCTVNKTFTEDLPMPDDIVCTSEEGGAHTWNKCLGGIMFKNKLHDFKQALKKRQPELYTAMTDLAKTFDDDDLILAGELQDIDTLSACLTKRTNVLQDLQYVKSS